MDGLTCCYRQMWKQHPNRSKLPIAKHGRTQRSARKSRTRLVSQTSPLSHRKAIASCFWALICGHSSAIQPVLNLFGTPIQQLRSHAELSIVPTCTKFRLKLWHGSLGNFFQHACFVVLCRTWHVIVVIIPCCSSSRWCEIRKGLFPFPSNRH